MTYALRPGQMSLFDKYGGLSALRGVIPLAFQRDPANSLVPPARLRA